MPTPTDALAHLRRAVEDWDHDAALCFLGALGLDEPAAWMVLVNEEPALRVDHREPTEVGNVVADAAYVRGRVDSLTVHDLTDDDLPPLYEWRRHDDAD